MFYATKLITHNNATIVFVWAVFLKFSRRFVSLSYLGFCYINIIITLMYYYFIVQHDRILCICYFVFFAEEEYNRKNGINNFHYITIMIMTTKAAKMEIIVAAWKCELFLCPPSRSKGVSTISLTHYSLLQFS